jgi:hypothetical protein
MSSSLGIAYEPDYFTRRRLRKARPGRRTCLGHPLFPDQVEALAAQVEALRARFFQQYRLFFRYHRASRIIVYAWVNDEHAKRA